MLRVFRAGFTKLSPSFLLVGLAVLFNCSSLQAQNPININPVGTANPYPSTITVSGRTDVVSKVTVTLTGFTHNFPDDVDMMLVAPNGARAIILSDVGGEFSISNVNITLDDAALSNLPDEAPITSGTYKPTNFEPNDPFVNPAPSTSANTALSTFNGSSPNGDWKLYVIDDNDLDGGNIVNFTLTIETAPVVTAANGSLRGRVSTANGRAISGARVTAYDVNTQQYHNAGTNQFGYFNLKDLPVGNFYIVTIRHKRYTFSSYTQGIQLNADEVINFVAELPQ
jgi:subtilisin-like proprotein convertase family protein